MQAGAFPPSHIMFNSSLCYLPSASQRILIVYCARRSQGWKLMSTNMLPLLVTAKSSTMCNDKSRNHARMQNAHAYSVSWKCRFIKVVTWLAHFNIRFYSSLICAGNTSGFEFLFLAPSKGCCLWQTRSCDFSCSGILPYQRAVQIIHNHFWSFFIPAPFHEINSNNLKTIHKPLLLSFLKIKL